MHETEQTKRMKITDKQSSLTTIKTIELLSSHHDFYRNLVHSHIHSFTQVEDARS